MRRAASEAEHRSAPDDALHPTRRFFLLPKGRPHRSEEGYGATVERRGRENQCATPYREYAALIWTRSAGSHPGPRHETRRIRGRTHVSTRRRAAPRTTILLAPKGASTHVARIGWLVGAEGGVA